MALEKVPASHGSGADDPAGQYDPGSHSIHSVCPGSSWYLPPSHGEQEGIPAAGAMEPAVQGVGAVEPVEQEWPTVHGVHSSLLVKLVAFEKVVAGQGSAAAAPSPQ